MPRTLIASSLPSLADNNSTLLILNRVGGNLASHVGAIGDLSGLVFDDLEHSLSFVANAGCQFRQLISSTFPRATPRFPQFVPSGHTGWMKIAADNGVGILGAMLVLNSSGRGSPSAFNGGRNLHKSAFTESVTFTIPVFPPRCQ